jgi:hypothetical protein
MRGRIGAILWLAVLTLAAVAAGDIGLRRVERASAERCVNAGDPVAECYHRFGLEAPGVIP